MGKAQGETQGFFKEVIGKAEALLQGGGREGRAPRLARAAAPVQPGPTCRDLQKSRPTSRQ